MNKDDVKTTKKKLGRPTKDNVQLNMRYPRSLDERIRQDGMPSDVITPILMLHYGLSDE